MSRASYLGIRIDPTNLHPHPSSKLAEKQGFINNRSSLLSVVAAKEFFYDLIAERVGEGLSLERLVLVAYGRGDYSCHFKNKEPPNAIFYFMGYAGDKAILPAGDRDEVLAHSHWMYDEEY